MSIPRTSRIALVVPASLAVLALAGCGGSSSGSLSSVPSVSPSAPSSTAASPTAAASPAVDQTINITYANGKVTGVGTRVKVKSGSTVALVVTSDVADEVHFHGYNKMADVTKGGTVTIAFKATIPGVFEVELEKLKHRLVLLQIQ
jgi:hypothetical protein